LNKSLSKYNLKLFPFELGMHYNVEGYRKVAEAIHKFISNKKTLYYSLICVLIKLIICI